jgi:hypothetical protein
MNVTKKKAWPDLSREDYYMCPLVHSYAPVVATGLSTTIYLRLLQEPVAENVPGLPQFDIAS